MSDQKSPDDLPIDDAFTRDLEAAASGDAAARDRLWGDHYELLLRAAKDYMTNRWGQQGPAAPISIGGTHVLHAVYERMRNRLAAMAKGRAWFFRCFQTECMRVAVEHYRRTKRHKFGGGARRKDLDSVELPPAPPEVDYSGLLIGAIDALAKVDPVAAQIATYKLLCRVPDEECPGGHRSMQNQEIADLIEYSLSLVEKRWKFALAFIRDWMDRNGGGTCAIEA
jgi:hypothetical protein